MSSDNKLDAMVGHPPLQSSNEGMRVFSDEDHRNKPSLSAEQQFVENDGLSLVLLEADHPQTRVNAAHPKSTCNARFLDFSYTSDMPTNRVKCPDRGPKPRLNDDNLTGNFAPCSPHAL